MITLLVWYLQNMGKVRWDKTRFYICIQHFLLHIIFKLQFIFIKLFNTLLRLSLFFHLYVFNCITTYLCIFECVYVIVEISFNLLLFKTIIIGRLLRVQLKPIEVIILKCSVFYELSADLYKSIKSFSQSKNNTGSFRKDDDGDE